jgi:hypothetical protein
MLVFSSVVRTVVTAVLSSSVLVRLQLAAAAWSFVG